MENPAGELTPCDRLYLERAYELATRGAGSTAPNPPVGAVVVRDGRAVGEGYHRRAGEAHAERIALERAGSLARGATLYVSLEPCRHHGRTPPCTQAVLDAGIARVVAGTKDPTGHGGAHDLRDAAVAVTIAGDPQARELIEAFAVAHASDRPYVALKMAASLDGMVASRPGIAQRIGSDAEARYVRDLRTRFDAVLVGAATVRIDDPQLTVRPHHDRARPYVRIVARGRQPIPPRSRIFESVDGYDETIVLSPEAGAERVDLETALPALRARGIYSVLCEGGPRLAAGLLAGRLVDRIYWALAPRFLQRPGAVPALSGCDVSRVGLYFDRVERVGSDVMISGVPNDV